MFQLIFWAIVASAVAGLIAKFMLDRSDLPEKITWKEFGIAMAIIALLVAPGVSKIGWEMAKSDLVQYNEYLNGWETQAIEEDIACERDGSCAHDYDCDPYTVTESYSCDCDSKGNCQTCYREVTKYHSCPYVSVESNYIVDTTLGAFTIDTHRFPENPQSYRWRRSEVIPQYEIERAGVGAPVFWSTAKTRIDAQNPGPVCTRHSYTNYILASDQTILKQFSSDIDRLNSKGLLPRLHTDIHDFYVANKVYFVGYKPTDEGVWQLAVGRLDSALGYELQGDLHLVIVQNSEISNDPDLYTLALKAYWQNTKVFSRDAFSKNGIGIVVGTADGRTVSWARAFTGMPLGNEDLLVAVRNNLKDISLTPENVVGNLQGHIQSENGKLQVRGKHGQGAIENTVWGFSDPHAKFHRYSMSGKTGAGSGFLYLKGEIQPTSGQKFWIFFCTFILSGLVFTATAFIGERTYKRDRWSDA